MLLRIIAVCYALLRCVLAFGLLRRKPRSDSRPSVSVIVAARNEAAALPRMLECVLGQTYRDYEVIVVDDRSTDETAEVVAQWQARDDRLRLVRLTDVPPDRAPKMHALAQGVKHSRGELLLFTDADCEVPRTWIEGIVSFLESDVGAIIGYVGLRAANGTLMEHVQAFDYFAMMATTAGATGWGQPLGAGGANLAYRRAAYDQAGGFEAMPPGAVADDMLLLQRVIDRTGWRVAFCDDQRAFITTDAEPTLKRLLQQRVRWIAGGGDVIQDNPALLATGVIIGTFNGMLLGAPWFWQQPHLRRALLQALALRALADALHFGVAAARFHRPDLLLYLPLWSVIQIPYTQVLPMLSLVGRWKWKA
jgi:poly-beta-1,6-N-acetyl-D-glucosamine synthase